jgi:hypothetical protein
MKRLLGVALLAGCHSSAPAHVEVDAAIANAPGTSSSRAEIVEADASVAAVTDAGSLLKQGVAAIHSSTVGSWAAKFPAAKTFKTFDASGSSKLLITWRVSASHAKKSLSGADDYSANHVSPTELVIGDVHIKLGDLIGAPSPSSVSFCKNMGFHVDGDAGWTFPRERSVASAFTMSTAQGSDDYVLVHDGATLHLLHRETSDGRCDDGKQGPLDICQGFEYSRIADIGIGTADLAETIDEAGKPLDCLAPEDGLRLVFP